MIISPKNAIELVLDKKAKDKSFRFYETKVQKWLLWLTTASFTVCVVLGLCTYIFKNQYLMMVSLVILLLSAIFLLAFQIASTGSEFIKMRNPEKAISSNLLNTFNVDIDLINELSATFEVHHLRYAKNCYQQMSKQLRERISVLVGAIEKVGIIPLAVTGYFSYSKAKTENLLSFGVVEWLSISFIFLYWFSIRMTFTAQWMEKVSEIYNEALKLREKT